MNKVDLRKTKIALTVALLMVLQLFVASNIFAAEVEKDEALREAVTNQKSNSYTEEFKKNPPKRIRQHIYEKATLKSLAYLQLGLSFIDPKEDENIDILMKITECELYNRFKADEFEWEKIREATREFIRQNKIDFPMRFELTIPLKLSEYNEEKSYFDIQKKSQIKSVRLFEMIANDARAMTTLCGDKHLGTGNFYKGILLELSRPFSMTTVPVDNETAKRIIKEKSEVYQKTLKNMVEANYNQEDLYDLREFYLVMYIKIFTYKGNYYVNDSDAYNLAQVLAVVEGYEIFEDVGRKNLLYSRNYITKKNKVKDSQNIKREIEIVKGKIKSKGILF